MKKLSVVIITYNEERNIARCIDSVAGIADEVIVLDSLSKDKTVEIAAAMGAKIYTQAFTDYVRQKNIAIDLAKNNWVLSLDADEAVSPQLKNAITQTLKEEPRFSAYEFARKTSYCGDWVMHGGWYPDKKIRLFDTTSGRWKGEQIHEYWEMHDDKKPVGFLEGDLLHYSFNNLSDHLRKIDVFSEMQAKIIAEKPKKIGILKIVFSPFWRFIDIYFFKLGLLDGMTGFNIALMSAYANFMKYAKARYMAKQKSEVSPK